MLIAILALSPIIIVALLSVFYWVGSLVVKSTEDEVE